MRVTYLDTTKGILVLGMIMAHIIQFFGEKNALMSLISLEINLVSFSGFLFCFGYAAYLAYIKKDKIPKKRMTYTVIKILITFYISGAAYRFFVSGGLTLEGLFQIVFLFDIPGYSEFLLSFFLIILISIVYCNQIRHLVSNKIYFIVSITLCLLATFINYSVINIPQLGLFIGTKQFAAFPVVQYFPIFLLGAYFARNNIEISNSWLITAFFLMLALFMYMVFFGRLPLRFPPSALWIASSFGLVYFYYVFAIIIDKVKYLAEFIRNIGRNVLYWLLISNLLIFTLALKIERGALTYEKILMLYGVIVFVIYFLNIISSHLTRRAT